MHLKFTNIECFHTAKRQLPWISLQTGKNEFDSGKRAVVAVKSVFGLEENKYRDSYTPFTFIFLMDVTMSKTRKLFSASKIAGYLLGLLGISAFAVTQFLSALMPLLFAPMVCAVLGLVLYKSQAGQKTSNIYNTQSNAVAEQSV